MKAIKQIFRWLLKKDFKNIQSSYITIKDGKKIVLPNKILTNLEDVAVATTLNVNKNFLKLVLENGDILYAEMSINDFLILIKNDDFMMISKSVVMDLSLVTERPNGNFLMYLNEAYKIGKAYLPSIDKYFKEKYNC